MQIGRGFEYGLYKEEAKRNYLCCLLCGKGLQFNSQLDCPPDIKASQAWLRNFKCHLGIQEVGGGGWLYLGC